MLPIAMDDNFEKFMEFCDTYLHNAVRKFLERVRKRYNECDEAFRVSSDLLDKIVYTKEKIYTDDLRFFAHLREFYNVLKNNRKEELEHRYQDKETKKLKRCLEHSEVVCISNDSKHRKISPTMVALTAIKHENEYEEALQQSCVSGEINGQIGCSIFPDGVDDVVQEDEKDGEIGELNNKNCTDDENHGVVGQINNKSDIDDDQEDENHYIKGKINNKSNIDNDQEYENLGVKGKIINKSDINPNQDSCSSEKLTYDSTALDETGENKLHKMKIKRGKAYLPLKFPKCCLVDKNKKILETSKYDQTNNLNANAKAVDVAIHKCQSQDESEGEKRSDKKLSATASQREVTNGESMIRLSCYTRINGSDSKHGLKVIKYVEGGLNSDSSSTDFEENCYRFNAGTKKRNKSNPDYLNGNLCTQSLPKRTQKGGGASVSNVRRKKGKGKKQESKNKIQLLIVTDSESDSDFDYTQSTPRKWNN